MHQHPRSPAPQATSARSNLSRSAERRESENRPTSPAADPRVQQSRGLGIETESGSIDPAQSTQPSKEAVAKLNQIISVRSPVCVKTNPRNSQLTPLCIQNYHTKAALIILHSRVELPPSYNKGSDTPRVNRWVRAPTSYSNQTHQTFEADCCNSTSSSMLRSKIQTSSENSYERGGRATPLKTDRHR